MKKTALTLALVPACMILSGCSALGIDEVFNQDEIQYENSATRANLEVPPGMTPIGNDGRFEVPKRPSVVTASAEAQRQMAALRGKVVQSSDVLVTTTTVQVMRDGQQRWLRIDAPADKVWTAVTNFWARVGLTLQTQNPKIGFMETTWAENKARLPQDAIRQTIGKVLDFLYSTSERDQYRLRMERTESGATDIYVTHRSMVEVAQGKDAETTIWQPGPTDPTLETAMMSRLALYLDEQFNPDAQKLNEKEIKAELTALAQNPVAQLEMDAQGQASAIILSEGFDRAWRTMGLVLDRMGFDQVDRDRAAGYFEVNYLDPQYEERKKDEKGFFDKVFSSDRKIATPVYRIQLRDLGDKTRVVIRDQKGQEDTTGVAPTLLGLLAEQIR